MTLLAGCANVAPERVIVPELPAPPQKAITALEQACKKDTATCKWIVDLDKHYEKLDRAQGKRVGNQ